VAVKAWYFALQRSAEEKSALTGVMQQCLAEGKIFRREQVSTSRPTAASRARRHHIPIAAGQERATEGPICLLSDLTEMESLRKEMQLAKISAARENFPPASRMIKNAWPRVPGLRAMIKFRSEAYDTPENDEKISMQTAASPTVTEFLRYGTAAAKFRRRLALRPLLDRHRRRTKRN